MDEIPITVNAVWALDPAVVPAFANQCLVQLGVPPLSGKGEQDGIYLTFGHLNPPAFPGTPEEAQAAANTQMLPVIPVARVVMTRARVTALHAALGELLDATAGSEKSPATN